MRLLSLRHALRDLRASLRHLRLLSACLILSVGVMSGIGLVVENIKASIEKDARSLLGGDVEVRQIFEPLPLEVESFLSFRSRAVSRTIGMRTMAKTDARQSLVELKGVDGTYPLYGELTYKASLSKKQRRQIRNTLNFKGRLHQAAVDQSFIDIMHMQLGDVFSIGKARFIVNHIIETEPDRGFSTMTLGPRVLISRDAFKQTGLLQYGSMAYYRTRILLAANVSATQLKQELAEAFPEAPWRVRDWNDSAPGLVSLIDRLSLFFALTAITALMVSGIGIANASSVYIWSKRQTIALMKCLGGAQHHITLTYLTQILIISLVSIAIGCLLGVAGQIILLEWLSEFLTVKTAPAVFVRPIILSALLALVTVLLFTMLPLLRSKQIKPAALLRGDSAPATTQFQLPRTAWAMMAGLMLILVGLSILYTGTPPITLYFAAGLAASMAVLYWLGVSLQRGARHAAHSKRFSVRFSLILSNLARPGAATRSMVVALGISMSLIIALVQVGSNLRSQIEQGLPENAPSFFLADIQPSQLTPLLDAIKSVPGTHDVTSLPMSRGRIVRLNDVPVEKAEIADKARWATRSERGLTESAAAPNNTVLADGEWWPENYNGKTLVSFDQRLADGMGLGIGDSITIATIDKQITATIANLREIQWGTLEMNFAIILSPGALEGLPITHLVTAHVPAEQEKTVQRLLADDYSNVVAVRVREVLGQVSGILESVSTAVLLTAFITVLCGILVMAGAIHASLHKRIFDTVMYKVLGANKKQILHMYLVEFAMIACVVAVIAIIIGSVAAFSVMQLMIFSQFEARPAIALAALATSLFLAILLGMIATRFTLSVRPLSLLRNE